MFSPHQVILSDPVAAMEHSEKAEMLESGVNIGKV